MLRKKKILPLFIASMLSLSLIGCSSSKEKNTTETGTPVELTISAAASLKEVMAELEPMFTEDNSNVTLTFTYGSSGSLQQQIEQGAPSDLFISAGKKQMTTLEEEDLLLENTNKDLVKNSLVLIGPKDTTLTSLEDIKGDAVKNIAVGEPSSVPAGKYADEVLNNVGIMADVKSRLVFAKDVKEVLTWTTTGNAEAGFVYLSDAISSDSAKIIETISEDLHSPITYPVAVIKSSKNPDTAKAFEDFLFTDEAQKVFEKYGYKSVE